MTLLLVVVTPGGTPAFWLTLGAFAALVVMHALYWLLTHPVNNFWLAEVKLKGFGAKFFGSDPIGRGRSGGQVSTPDWTVLRDRWEYSHLARAVFAMLGLVLLVTAVAL